LKNGRRLNNRNATMLRKASMKLSDDEKLMLSGLYKHPKNGTTV